MYENEVSYFKSVYDKDICLYGKQTIYEPLEITETQLYDCLMTARPLPSKQICFGLRIAGGYQGWILIFERLSFSIKNISLLKKLFANNKQSVHKRLSIEGIFFIDCQFITPLIIEEPISIDLCFRNCLFRKELSLKSKISKDIIFNKCNFKERFDLENTSISNMFYIEESIFGKNSIVNLNKAYIETSSKFVIRDTLFLGRFEARNANLLGLVKLTGISFFNILDMKGISFNKQCIFENIAFAHPGTQQILDTQKELVKALEKSGCEKEIANLGLNIGQNIDDTEEREYQDALQKGWLNPKQAARFLGKSVRTLQEKRKNDQIQITKESLPFKGIGRDIVYPLDALKAYLEQDWNLLKELRKKHWNKD